MSQLLARDFPPPRDWQAFERLTFDLFSRMWRTNDAELHGRQGQSQSGVDVYGTDRHEGGRFTGVQCKGRDASYGSALKESELRDEVAKALTFQPPLEVFVVVTTAPNDVAIQKIAREISRKHEGDGRFEVRVMGWDTLKQRITDYPELVQKHFTDLAPIDLVGAIERWRSEAGHGFDQVRSDIQQQTRRLLVGLQDAAVGGDALALRIGDYAKLTEGGSPRAALRMLRRILDEEGETASPLARFRLFGNMASAHFALGEDDEAMAQLRRSYEAYPDYPNAQASMAMLHVLEGNRDDGLALAKAALARDPGLERAAMVLIDAAPLTVPLAELEGQLSQDLLDKASVQLALSGRAHRVGDQQASLRHAEAALAVDPRSWRAQAAVAEALMQPLSGEEGVELTRALPEELRPALTRATDLLRKAWTSLAAQESSHLGRHVAYNFMSCLLIGGEEGEADEVLDQAIQQNPTYAPLRVRFAQRAAAEDDWQAADAALGEVDDDEATFEELAFRAHVKLRLKDVPGTRDMVGRMATLAQSDVRRQIVAAFEALADSLEGANLLEATNAKLADYPNSVLIRSVVFDFLPEEEPYRAQLVEEITTLAGGELSKRERLHAAETLYAAGQYGLAADLYAPLHGVDVDSTALSRHLRALHLAGRRAESRELYERLPSALRTSQRYLGLGINIYMEAGLLRRALDLVERSLQTRDDLHDRLVWVDLQLRQGRREPVATWLRQVPDDIAGSPRELINLAGFVDRHLEDDNKALALGYRALRAGYADPQVHLGFAFGLMLMGRNAERDIATPDRVEPGAGVILHDDATGERLLHVIETGEDPRPERGELAPADPFAQQLLGLAPGDTVEVARMGADPLTYRVAEIQSAYLFALHRTLREFTRLFPGHPAFGSMTLGDGDKEDQFEPVFAVARRRATWINNLKDRYQEGTLPLCLIAPIAGMSVFELWEAFRSGESGRFLVAQELDAEVQAGRASAEAGLTIVDPLAVYTWVRLGLAPVIEKVRDRLGIVQTSIDLLRALLDEREDHRGRTTGSLGWDGEHYHMVRLSPEAIEASIVTAREAVAFAENLHLVPAEAAEPLPQEIRDLLEGSAPAFLDTILASRQEGRAVLTDDLGLRVLAQSAGAQTTWTQPWLEVQVRQGTIGRAEYRATVEAMIEAKYDLTMFGHGEVLAALQEASWTMNDVLRRYVRAMVRPNVNPESLVRMLSVLVLDSRAVTASDVNRARFHVALVAAFEEDGRGAFAVELYKSLIVAVYQQVRARLGRALLPSRLRSTTYLNRPEDLAQELDNGAQGHAQSIMQELLRGGLRLKSP